MARHESDREDLLKEARGLPWRAEFALAGFDEPVVLGLRPQGVGSIYLGQDPVYHFNSRGQLRRAYRDGLLLKAEGGRLVSLRRQRRDGRVLLVRREFSPSESTAFRQQTRADVLRLRKQLQSGAYQLQGQVPADEDVVSRLQTWLNKLPDDLPLAATARVC